MSSKYNAILKGRPSRWIPPGMPPSPDHKTLQGLRGQIWVSSYVESLTNRNLLAYARHWYGQDPISGKLFPFDIEVFTNNGKYVAGIEVKCKRPFFHLGSRWTGLNEDQFCRMLRHLKWRKRLLIVFVESKDKIYGHDITFLEDFQKWGYTYMVKDKSGQKIVCFPVNLLLPFDLLLGAMEIRTNAEN